MKATKEILLSIDYDWHRVFGNCINFLLLLFMLSNLICKNVKKILLSMQLNQRIEMSYQVGHQWSWYILLYLSCHWSNLLLVCLACVRSKTSYIVFGEASHIWQVEYRLFLGHSNLVYFILNFLRWCHWDAWSPWRGEIYLFNFSFYLSFIMSCHHKPSSLHLCWPIILVKNTVT